MSSAVASAGDVDAVRRIRAGDLSGLEEMYRRHARAVFAAAMHRLGHRPDAEDAAHDAFLAILERARQFEPSRGTPLAWLLATVRHLAIDRARQQARRARITADVLSQEPREQAVDCEARLCRAREGVGFRARLASISNAQRRTLELVFLEGLTHREIAKCEGVPLGTVKARAARGLMALRAGVAPRN